MLHGGGLEVELYEYSNDTQVQFSCYNKACLEDLWYYYICPLFVGEF